MNRKIADIIEDMILQQLAIAESILISRNQLAQELACAPSQISYVLQSRFNQERGFMCHSKRGSGGFVRIGRLTDTDREAVNGELHDEQEQIKQVLSGLMLAPQGLNECQIKVLAALKQLLDEEACNRMQLNWVRGALIYIVK